MLKQVTALKS